MEYRISFRALNTSDINVECPFLPEIDEFEMSFEAMIEDIKGFAGIKAVSAHEGNSLFITAPDIDLQTLKEKLKPHLQQHFQRLRIAVIETL